MGLTDLTGILFIHNLLCQFFVLFWRARFSHCCVGRSSSLPSCVSVCLFCGDEDCSLRLLLCSCSVTEELPPFSREIQPEELWLYKFHPVKKDRVPTRLMFVSACHSYSAMKLHLNIPCRCLNKGISLPFFSNLNSLSPSSLHWWLFFYLPWNKVERPMWKRHLWVRSVCFINIYIYKIYIINYN